MGKKLKGLKKAASSGKQPPELPIIGEYLPKNPPFFVVCIFAFAAIILLGTLLLWIPEASVSGESVSFTDALFTASSALSCTGLTVLDTAAHWSFFGQIVILVLIQLGGFGFMLISAYLLIVFGRHLNLLDFRFSNALDVSSSPEYIKFALQTIALTLLFEGIGVLLLYWRFSSIAPSDDVLWNSVFHSISAFNNAGFIIMSGEMASGLYADNFLLLTISGLVILGGVSAPVIINLFAFGRWRGLNLNSKIALTFTFGLLLVGLLGVLFMEYDNGGSLGPLSVPQKIVNAFFYSASARTAGFSPLDVGNFGFHALALVMILMFIGGVAGSTAGGIKVNTFATLILTMRSYIMGDARVRAFGKQIPEARVHEAITVVFLFVLVLVGSIFILTFTEELPGKDIVFESFSAFSTVGLSTGITSSLSEAGRLILALCMFVGRLGPLTIVLAISERRRAVEVIEPQDALKTW
ncbi:TrkH family potassium uptake protein [Chloroflexota bacterium]